MSRLAATLALALVACAAAPRDTGPSEDAVPAKDLQEAADAGTIFDASAPDAANDATTTANPACSGDTLDANRNRLLDTYYQYVKANVSTPQSNGISSAVTSALDLWQKLDPSSRAVFLTITARMQGSIVAADGSSMLSHITKLYRCVGGAGATSTDPGSCGGGEANRMIMSMDATLHDAQVAANHHGGALQSNGKHDIGDVIPSSYWRDSHDLAGPHGPFDLSDETNGGAPRGQTQFFADPTSTRANAALGRQDLAKLVDPYAIEMDQDYDCTHNSNPLCEYTLYGAECFPQTPEVATKIYSESYGSYGASYAPASCQ